MHGNNTEWVFMKYKGYTLSHDHDLLHKIDNNGGQFTAKEKAFIMKKEHGGFKGRFSSKSQLLRELPRYTMGPRLSFLQEYIELNNYSSILSMGAGSCVQEYLLKMILPENTKIVCTDFDEYSISKAKEFFGNSSKAGKKKGGGLIPIHFDFFNDNIDELISELDFKIDVAIFLASSYVMDDEKFIELFKSIGENGITTIIDFHAGYIDLKEYVAYSLKTIKNIFSKGTKYQGKFHGYFRSRKEIRRLYALSGWTISRETSVVGTPYVAILKYENTI
jgi:hypothetical protein